MPILAAEPDLYPDNLFEERSSAELTERFWWVLHTKPRQEKRLAEHLHSVQVPFFLPLLSRRLRMRGRVLTSFVPLFPGYVFLFGTREERNVALATSRVVRPLKAPDQEALWDELAQLFKLIRSGVSITPESTLAPGTQVEIRSGPLMGMRGRIVDQASRRRFVVEVNFIQKGASVLLEDFALAAIDDGSG